METAVRKLNDLFGTLSSFSFHSQVFVSTLRTEIVAIYPNRWILHTKNTSIKQCMTSTKEAHSPTYVRQRLPESWWDLYICTAAEKKTSESRVCVGRFLRVCIHKTYTEPAQCIFIHPNTHLFLKQRSRRNLFFFTRNALYRLHKTNWKNIHQNHLCLLFVHQKKKKRNLFLWRLYIQRQKKNKDTGVRNWPTSAGKLLNYPCDRRLRDTNN